jgi:probable HAF family extracellular repeat protein
MHIRRFSLVAAGLLVAACGGSGPELGADVQNAVAPKPAENSGAPAMAHATATSATGSVGSWTVSVTDLGLLPGGTMASARAINNTGKIVGIATDASFAIRRVIWDVNGTVLGDLPNYDPSSTAEPASINDADFVAGTENISSTLREAVYWSKGVTGYTAIGLTPLNQGSWVQTTARAISPSGWIAGSSKDGATGVVMAVLWNNNTAPVSLGVAGESFGVGDVGGAPHAVGVYANGSLSRAFLWRSGKLTDLGAVGGSGVTARANAVSNTGFVAGSSDGGTIPVRWRYDVASAGGDPTLERLPMPTDLALPSPVAVNGGGDVVGSAWTSNFARTRAVLWRNGEVINLGTWPGGLNSRAYGINDAGQIVGEGDTGDGRSHALLWTVTASTGTNPPPSPTNTTPTVSITSVSSSSLKIGGTLTVQGRFSDPDNGPWTYRFDWGDGTSTTGSAASVGALSSSHMYQTASLKKGLRVVLTVTDAKGASGSASSGSIRVSR